MVIELTCNQEHNLKHLNSARKELERARDRPQKKKKRVGGIK